MIISIKPCQLFLPFCLLVLGFALLAIDTTNLRFSVQLILYTAISLYTCYEILKYFQYIPYNNLSALALPPQNGSPWLLQLKHQKTEEARLLNSTRIHSRVIVLHFRLLHHQKSLYQIILPSMTGAKNFHDLLVYLKTNQGIL